MNKKILVTDSLFIFNEHIKKLSNAGIEIERLDKPDPSDAELITVLKDKDGYILGGIERVSDKVFESVKNLKVISLTGTGWDHFIPGWQRAVQKGIKITNAPHANAQAVSEWVFSAGLAMHRNLFGLGLHGDKSFETVKGIDELKVGIVGMGHVGQRTAELFEAVGAQVSYYSRSKKDVKFKYQTLEGLLKTSDLVCVCVSSEAGDNYLDSQKLALLKNGAIITSLTISTTDENALLNELKTGRIRAYLDWMPKNQTEEFKKLPPSIFYCSKEGTAFNTHAANKLASDWATQSVINILSGKDDPYIVK